MENVADCLLLELRFQEYYTRWWAGNALIDADIERRVWVAEINAILPFGTVLDYWKSRR